MSEANKGYELEMLKMVVNQYLDRKTSFTEQSLNKIETNRDQFIWDIVTKIYQESGRKVELSFVRDIVDSRIKAIKHKLAEEPRHIAEQKTQKAAKIEVEEETAIFVRVREIISEQLGVEEREVTLDSHLSNHFNADGYDLKDVVIALEEEFYIEISDEVLFENSLITIAPFDFWNISKDTGSSPYCAGEKCIVRNFVDLIRLKLDSAT